MKYLITLIGLICFKITFAQFPDTTIETPEVRAKAEKLTEIYNAQLGLDGSQLPVFENKVADYLTLAKEIRSAYKGKEALDKLTKLMVKESLEMKDILTRIQYNEYKKIRQSIQPLKIVEPSEKD